MHLFISIKGFAVGHEIQTFLIITTLIINL